MGVEAFLPYLKTAKEKNTHEEYIDKKIQELEFPENSFDAVIMIEVIEHMTREDGLEILRKAEKWARKKVIVSTPSGYFPMGKVDNNIFQRHLSGWTLGEFRKWGYHVYGVSGIKFFYQGENQVDSLLHCDSASTNIRFRPRVLFYGLNAFFQIFNYYRPGYSFGLLAVKYKKHE